MSPEGMSLPHYDYRWLWKGDASWCTCRVLQESELFFQNTISFTYFKYFLVSILACLSFLCKILYCFCTEHAECSVFHILQR